MKLFTHRKVLYWLGSCLLINQPLQAQVLKWDPHVEVEVKTGSQRNLGSSQVFLPLYQTEHRLLFADFRGKLDSHSSREMNLGLGYRELVNQQWIWGGYAFFDRRRSDHGNHFNQVTLGTELLSEQWDARVNGYLPVGRSTYSMPGYDQLSLHNSSIGYRAGEEKAMKGFDAEIGRALPLPAAIPKAHQLRLYGGGYHFTASNTPDISGPRARLEYSINSLPLLGRQSRFSIGGEWQHDDIRGSQGFLGIKLRIPLLRRDSDRATLTALEQRMVESPVRDVDIVSQAGTFGSLETGIDPLTGRAFDDMLIISEAEKHQVTSLVNGARPDQIIFLNTDQDTRLETEQTLALKRGQVLAGRYRVQSPSTGRSLEIGTGARIHNPRTDQDVIRLASDTGLHDLTLSGGRHGIQGDGANRITLNTLTIHDTAQAGLNYERGEQLTAHRLHIYNLDQSSADGFSNGNPLGSLTAVGIRLNEATQVNISESRIEKVGIGLLGNRIQDLALDTTRIVDTSQEGIALHLARQVRVNEVEVGHTSADGIAIVVGDDIRIENSRIHNIGIGNIGMRSGINISTFTADPSVANVDGYNSNYHLENLTIDSVSNAGLFLAGVDGMTLKDISISNTAKSGIITNNSPLSVMKNMTLDKVVIDHAAVSGISLNGPFEKIDGDLRVTNSGLNCSMWSSWNAPSFTQGPEDVFSINGTALNTGSAGGLCPEAF
ncbi:inverse autotransporter beta domain-containing protein [Oceanisphaera sp. KMM 10153]|uniref:inverse autotransporter beta domain-containing protein n=1 Tax=Oceanisphaera submarina TaxID=3390193 RepID=UPI00397474D8